MAKKVAAKKTVTKKATARKVAVKKVAVKKVAARKAPASKVTRKRTAASTPRKRTTARGTTARKRRISPEQALARTRELLAEKQQQDREPAPWQQLDQAHSGIPPQADGFQSSGAAAKQVDLHAAESRMKAIQGSMSARDRRNQGKRDHRGEE